MSETNSSKSIYNPPKEGILRKLVYGGFWNALSQFGGQAINFVVTLILARLLSPKEFGLIGMVLVFSNFLLYFTNLGLSPSLIQKKNVDDLDVNTAFWSIVGMSLFLYIVAFLIAPAVGYFYRNKEIILIMRVLSVNMIIRSFTFVKGAMEIKKLNFRIITISSLISMSVSGIVGIFLALKKYGVWSLVFMQLVTEVTILICYYVALPWRPKFIFSTTRFKEMFSFSLHMSINRVIKSISENIDQLLLGRIVGPKFVGIYSMAHRVSRYPIEKVWQIIGTMLFPAFSIVQDDREKLIKALYKISILSGVIISPLLIFLFFGTKEIVLIVLKEKWIEVVPIIKIFCFYIFISSISIGDEPLLFALKIVKPVNIVKLFYVISLFILGYILTEKFKIIGMALSLSILTILHNIIIKGIIMVKLKISLFEYLRNIFSVICIIVTCSLSAAFYSIFLGKYILNSFLFLVFLGVSISIPLLLLCYYLKIFKFLQKIKENI
ncbi:MAG: lipopolysaccharide biosynthesis protein [Chitinispirillaceae bacterium]|nr:lipopolysaccharide biosynthesis protein [Chitinispirillaceae bacterium]